VILFNLPRKIFSRKPKPKQPKWSIVIDPGHGGRYPGAVNKTYGYMEKNINLHVANFMRLYIERSVPELSVRVTRMVDVAESLPNRCSFANELKPDAFISIHTNARCLKGKYGLEIETFHFRGSEKGRELAVDILFKLLECSNYDVPVINRGVKIGQRRGKDGELKDFYVLRETHMPAILVELGFLSDDEEARLLIKPENQEVMAKAIVDGVVAYLREKEEEK